MASLTSGDPLESSGQTEGMNQQLKTGLRCLVFQNPSTWSKRLAWVEYSHNSLPTSAAAGFSPFKCYFGYDTPVFPAEEPEVSVSSSHTIWFAVAVTSGQLPDKSSSAKVTEPRRQQIAAGDVSLPTRQVRRSGFLPRIFAGSGFTTLSMSARSSPPRRVQWSRQE